MIQHRSPLQTLALAVALGATPALVSCAQAPMTASAPAAAAPEPSPVTGAAGEPSPADLQGQIAALDEAEARITQLFGERREAEEAKPAASPPKTPKATDQATGVKKDKGAEQQLAQGDACGTACSALSSMERAAVHLCGLAGEGDPRCEGARTRVRSAADRVRASCPACAAR